MVRNESSQRKKPTQVETPHKGGGGQLQPPRPPGDAPAAQWDLQSKQENVRTTALPASQQPPQ